MHRVVLHMDIESYEGFCQYFSAPTLLVGQCKGIRPVKRTRCWFVGSDDLTGALHVL